ncbi:MAG: DUF1272 domain-containing protein, partial [Nitrospira sp.]|nr:DUF1272 domain-containing protein [Nitrospira sp.]
SVEARICSYECTVCAACVENVLSNVCLNCGGGLRAQAHQTVNELERQQLSWQGPGKYDS